VRCERNALINSLNEIGRKRIMEADLIEKHQDQCQQFQREFGDF
jgi:hypothetical protein